LDVYPFVLSSFYTHHMLKKLIASGSIAVIALSSLANGLVLGAPAVTDPELIDAVSWASDAGLTKYSDADAFMAYNNLTREQASKFASEFAASQLDMTADTSKACSFSDAASMDSSLVMSITKACQMGIMMGSSGKFMPKQLITRGQWATVVSRMLGGIDAMSSEQAHFEYLQSEGVMNTANLPSAITRGDALLMLYRVAGASSTDLCAIDPSLAGCSGTGTGTGTSSTGTTVVKAGDLNVSLNPSSPANFTSIPNAGSVKYATVDFTAGSKDVTVSSVDLMRSGLGNPSDFSRVYFEKAGLRVSARASVASDNKAIITFAPALVVKAGTTVSLDLYADMNAAVAGSENNFKSTAINSSAATVNGSIATPTLRTANYTVASVAVGSFGTGNQGVIKADDTNIEVGKFKLTTSAPSGSLRDVKFKAITLRNNGNGDVAKSLTDLYLERNGVKVSTDVIVNGKDVTFAVTDTIKDSTAATYYIRAKSIAYVDNATQDTYQFQLRNTSDLNATESITDFRTSVTPTVNPIATLGLYNVEGGDVKFAKDAGFVLSNTHSAGTNGVILMKGTITAKEPIYLEDVTNLTYTASTGANTIAKRFYLSIGGSTFSWTPSSAAVGTALFDGAVTINGTAAVQLWADIDTNAPAGSTITFGSLNLNSFGIKEYVSTQNAITSSVGSIQSANISIAASKLAISRNDGLASTTTIVKDSSDKLVYGVSLSNNQDNAIRVNTLTLTGSNPAFNNTVDLTVFVNGVATSTKRYNGATTFNSLNITVNKGTPVNVTVKADLVGTATGTMGTFALAAIDAIDTVSSNTASTTTLPIVGSTISVVDAGSINVVQGTTTASKLIASNAAAVALGNVNVEARNDGMTLTDAYISVSGATLSKFGTISLVDGATVYNGTKEGNIVKFEGLSVKIAANTTKTFVVKADVATVAYAADLAASTFSMTVATAYTPSLGATVGTVNGMRLISDANGQPVSNVTVTNPITPNHTIVAGYPVFSMGAAPTNNDVMNFTVTPNGNKIRLKSISYTSAGSAFTGTVELRDVNDLVVATGTVSAAGMLTLTAPGTEVASATAFKVYAPNYSKGVNDTQRSFTITDASFDQWTSSDGVWTNTSSIAGFKNAVGLSSFTATY
jgi:hypothetical protein